MPSQTRTKVARFDASKYHGLDRDALVRMYRVMFLSRRLDDKEIQLKRQNRIFFQISGAGHEAIGAAAGLLLRPGYDWFHAYYRDRALALMLGMTPLEMLLEAVGAKEGPSSAGRQMPSHWGHQKIHLITRSSPTGTQWVQSIGTAEASYYFEQFPKALEQAKAAPGGDAVTFEPDEITYVSGGEGSTSEGEFFEALNIASSRKLPLLFVVEDNAYAISVPVEVQTAGGNISRLVANYPHLHVAEYDGTDPIGNYAVFRRAIEHCRLRQGPALIHAHVIRPYSHSLSDDEKLYKTDAEREGEARRDPIPKFSLFLVREGILDEHEIEEIEASVD
ncbi:MAG TPA: thiamine pyrophosphate-dependent dehydrogenase E1 component subunit alpha, partial [Candidatus Acidoferrales bacterium]|nr:thiamine pyrophosphate-dependent dehydrogenase E1 component subunit alpha [Candidatus Acidoferrales bacterium]